MKKIFFNMLGLTILCQSVFGMNVAIDSTQDSGQNQTSLLYLDMKTLKKFGRIVLYYLDNNDGTFVGEPTMLEKTSYIGTTSRDQNQVNFAIHEDNVNHIHGELSDEIELDNEYEIAQQNFKHKQAVWHDMFVTFVQDPTPGEAMLGKLLEAIENGDLGIVQTLFDNGVDVNIAGKDGDTLLHDACFNGHLDIVQYLIDEGANINAQANKQVTPLHWACFNGHLPVVQYLIDEGANPNDQANKQVTPLHYACRNGHLPVVEYLISQGADIEAEDYDNQTPLHYACLYGHLDIVKYLISKGANVNAKTKGGRTPLHYAQGQNHPDMVAYLRSQMENQQ